jgi:FAD binding domain/Berberine and berberine like
MSTWHTALPDFKQRIGGSVLTVDDEAYDEELAVFNTSVRHQPALVVGADSDTDVCEAVAFAAQHGLSVGVLNTGHGPSLPADANTLMITTKRLTGIEIDPTRRTARVQSGVRFGQLVDAAAPFGLAPLAGSSPGVGAIGFTLSGGASPTIGRKYGWAADHVRALDVVMANGELRHTSAHSHADLFESSLGTKGNLGVVTAMECALFPVPRLFAGALFFAGEHARAVLEAYGRFAETAPDDVSTGVALLNFPPLPDLPPFMQGKLVVALRFSYVGATEAGQRLLEPLRAAAPLLMDTIADIPFTDFAGITADPTEPAAAVERFGLLRELTPDTVDAVLSVAGPEAGSTVNIVDIRHLQGAFSHPPAIPNAVGGRDAAFAFFGLTVVPPGGDIQDFHEGVTKLVVALTPWLHERSHPSFLGPADAAPDLTRRAYEPDVYTKLQKVKAIYDPTNMFSVNHNIPPAAGS